MTMDIYENRKNQNKEVLHYGISKLYLACDWISEKKNQFQQVAHWPEYWLPRNYRRGQIKSIDEQCIDAW